MLSQLTHLELLKYFPIWKVNMSIKVELIYWSLMARGIWAAPNSNNISYVVYTSLFIHFDIFISVWHFWQAMFPGNSIAALCIPYTCYRNENSIKEFSNQCKSKVEIFYRLSFFEHFDNLHLYCTYFNFSIWVAATWGISRARR